MTEVDLLPGDRIALAGRLGTVILASRSALFLYPGPGDYALVRFDDDSTSNWVSRNNLRKVKRL